MKSIENKTFRQSMSWLHTWAGLVLGSILYFMFITGATGYFDEEVTLWMQPEVVTNSGVDQAQMLAVAESRLTEVASDSKEWWINFPIGRRQGLVIWWKAFANKDANNDGKDDGEWKSEALDPQTGQPTGARKTSGGGTLYSMHYALHYIPRVLAYWLTSMCAMFMLIGLITGIVIHKKIFKDFFTFRPGKKLLSWLDMHNVLSVLPLPFHLMITYSGLLTLMFTTMPSVITASYGTGGEARDQFFDEAFQHAEHPKESDVLTPSISISSLLGDIETRWHKDTIRYIGVDGRGTEGAHIEVGRHGHDGLSGGAELMYHGVSGKLLHDSMQDHPHLLTSTKVYNVFYSLHEGHYASTELRWLYFLSALMGAGMIATGMILWASKRREKAHRQGFASKGLVLVERLNVGTVVGLPIAIAVYFWANRLIPAGLEGRENWEINSLFIVWAAMLAYPFLFARKNSLTHAWISQLSIATALYALLPLLNALTTDKHLGVSLLQGDWVMAGFDLSMWGFALCFGYAAYRMRGKAIGAHKAEQTLTAAVKTSTSKTSASVEVSV